MSVFLRFLAALLVISTCPGQQAIPDPVLNDSERAWLEEHLGVDLRTALLSEGEHLDLPSLNRGSAQTDTEHRLTTLWIRAGRQALWSADANLRLAAANRFASEEHVNHLFPRDVRRIVRTLGSDWGQINFFLDGDTLGEILRRVPPAPASVDATRGIAPLHRSLHRRHLPELARIAQAANDPTLRDSALRCASIVAMRSDVDAMRRFARDLARLEGQELSTPTSAQGLSDTLRFAIERALLQTSDLIVAQSRSWLMTMLRVERAGSRNLDLARRLLDVEESDDRRPLAREVAMRILADIGHRPILGAHRSDADVEVRMLALAGLSALGDTDAIHTLERDCVSSPPAALALAESDARRLGLRLGQHAARAERPEDLAYGSWQEWRAQSCFRTPDDLGDHLVAGYLAADCDPTALSILASSFAGCRTMRLAEALFQELEAREPGNWLGGWNHESGRQPESDRGWWHPFKPRLDLLELADEDRLRRLMRRWLLSEDPHARGHACAVLLQIGDPASATELIAALESDGVSPENLPEPWCWGPKALLARSNSLAVREFVTEELHRTRHPANDGSIDYSWGVYLAAAMLGGLPEAVAMRTLPDYVESPVAHEALRSSRWFRHLQQLRGIDAYAAWVEDDWTGTRPTFAAALLDDPWVGEAFRARYDRGHATAADLVRADPVLARRLIDDALATGWYGFFRFVYSHVPDEIWHEGDRLARLLDLTESNCCLGSYTTAILEELSPSELEIGWDDCALPFQRNKIRRYLPRLRLSKLTGKLAVAPR